MRSIADDLALIRNPISDEDLVVHIITQLGDEYNPIVAALKVRESSIDFSELFDKLTDFERTLKDKGSISPPTLVTTNVAQKQPTQTQHFNRSTQGYNANSRRSRGSYGGNNSRQNQNGHRSYRQDLFCRFCEIAGHDTPDCRKLARFLKENNIHITSSQSSQKLPSPVANATTSINSPAMSQQPWLFDSGASHHATSNLSALQTYSDYGGPDEIFLGNGKGLSISHTGHTQIHTPYKPITLSNVLCAPDLQNNLISIAKLCKTNQVSVEFFSSHFLVKDLRAGAPLMRGENNNDVYCATFPCQPQVNITTKASLSSWHHKLGHPSHKVLSLVLKHNGLVFPSMSISDFHCTSCSISKSKKLPFSQNSLVSHKPL
ncbi:hypothetical protein Syun_002749 [Stephania yunnanensis]|uniref:GAG-pre-integrase domain-containing protein n=1 Tax=Stephania yunnanensis TaxID=152371 RepID=A0AAP0LK93_9MAGN